MIYVTALDIKEGTVASPRELEEACRSAGYGVPHALRAEGSTAHPMDREYWAGRDGIRHKVAQSWAYGTRL